jgi:hypothetical protein
MAKKKAPKSPELIRIDDFRYIYFMYPFGDTKSPEMFIVRIHHTHVGKQSIFKNGRLPKPGDRAHFSGSGIYSLCVDVNQTRTTAHVTTSSVEAGVQLPTPAKRQTPGEIFGANRNFIKGQLKTHFGPVKQLLPNDWSFVNIYINSPGSSDWSVLDRWYRPEDW